MWKILVALLLALVALFLLAGRSLREMHGLARAGASVTVDGMVDQVPVVVRDRKLDHDVELQRRQVLDRQVQLNLSRRQLETLGSEVETLEERAARRGRLLAEAHPILEDALANGRRSVQFAGAEHELDRFQADLDALLAEEEREMRQLEIKRSGLSRLRRSMSDGEAAVRDMRIALAGLEQEVELLRARRAQAELEAQTLDIVSAVSSSAPSVASGIGSSAKQLRDDVSRLEAGNEARRAALPAAASPNHLSQGWERLERLRAVGEARRAHAESSSSPTSDQTSEQP